MAKSKKKVAKKTPAKRTGRGGSVGGTKRKCAVCKKRGHNKRSHEPGGKLA